MKSALVLMIAHLVLSLDGLASSKALDQMFDFFTDKKSSLVDESFEGLHFRIDPSLTKCTRHSPQKMICELLVGGDRKGHREAQLIFDKHVMVSPAGVHLIRLNRKNTWSKQYPSINRYVEEHLAVDGALTLVQQAFYFRYDNINLPVLLRAFDVVMNNRTNISVTAICDGHVWPMIRETLASIVSSIYKAAK